MAHQPHDAEDNDHNEQPVPDGHLPPLRVLTWLPHGYWRSAGGVGLAFWIAFGLVLPEGFRFSLGVLTFLTEEQAQREPRPLPRAHPQQDRAPLLPPERCQR